MNNKPTTRAFSPSSPSGGNAPRKSHSKTRRGGAGASASAMKAHGVMQQGPRPAELRRRRRRTVRMLYAVLGIEIIAAVFTSPALTVDKVRVKGLETLPEVERAQTLQALTLPRSTNLLRVPFQRLRRGANALPWVSEAGVPHSWGRAVTVNVTPRRPLFACKVGTEWYEMDSSRVPIRIARPTVINHLPHVVLHQEIVAQPGFAVQDTALAGAIHILQMLPQNSANTVQENRVNIAKIVIDQSDNICLNMRDGMEFKFGQADDLAAKVALVRRVYAKDPAIGQMLASINLSSPSAPACTPRAAEGSPLLPGMPLLPGNVTQ